MRNFLIVFAVYAIPAASLLIFAYVVERWINKQLKSDSK
jgi:hypothetical protein